MLVRGAAGVLLKAAGLIALVWAAPASADDWQLSCTFGDGRFATVVQYDAGGPDYSLVVTLAGQSELGRGQKIVLRPIQTPTEVILIGSGLADMSLVMRIDLDALKASVEIGNGVSWDYKNMQGRCSVVE